MKKFFLPFVVFVISSTLALYNISHFPKMMGDEGIYVSQAYWLTTLGKLGPYTYWYDHFPLGWAQIGLWQLLVGPLKFFDSTVLSARVFMGLVLGGTTTLLYLLAHILTKSKFSAALASLIFITSTLTLTFGRMVLLDNLAIFWLLTSLYLLFKNPHNLRSTLYSVLTLALAVLSKESLLFFIPPYLYTLYELNKDNSERRYSLTLSVITLFFFLSFFPLLALLKGELWPTPNQVSFLGTLLFQAGRGNNLWFWQTGSHFREMVNVWLSIDPILLGLGTFSTLYTLFFSKDKSAKLITYFALFFTLFLIRGGQIYDFYLIPLLPLLALGIAQVIQKFSTVKIIPAIFLVSLLTYLGINATYPLTAQATTAQLESLKTLKELQRDVTIIADNYPYLDLYISGHRAEWYQKVESDEEVRKRIGTTTYFAINEQFARELSGHQLPFLQSLVDNAGKAKTFGRPLSPGEYTKPYTSEYITHYALTKPTSVVQRVVTLRSVSKETLEAVSSGDPYAILLMPDNFANSTDLETQIKLIKATLGTSIRVMVIQDDTGKNTIPWISTPTRSFYKSAKEASDATMKKTEALNTLGLTDAVITNTSNADGYLQTIYDAGRHMVTPVLRFTGEVPTFESNLLVTNQDEVTKLIEQKFNGKILLLTSLPDTTR